jgi:hypothetical protein
VNAAWPVFGTLLAAAGGMIAVREMRWRALAARELADEVALGALGAEDLQALTSWKRFRAGWLADARERRAVRRIGTRLARAKNAQRKAPAARRKLLQVEVLTLRTRLRRGRPAALSSDGFGRPAGEAVLSSEP